MSYVRHKASSQFVKTASVGFVVLAKRFLVVAEKYPRRFLKETNL